MNSGQDIAQQTTVIRDALGKINAQLDSYEQMSKQSQGSEDVGDKAKIAVAHNALTHDAIRLLQTIRGPLDSVYEHAEKASQTATIRALLAMGVFEKIPVEGSITATELASALAVDQKLLVRLMRIVTIVGPFEQVREEEYSHTSFSKIFLVPEIRGLFTSMTDEFMIPQLKLYEFLPANGWKNPSDARNNPYTYAHQTGGKPMWEHLLQYPERMKAFNLAMGAQSESSMWSVDIVNFHSLLAPVNTTNDSILVVDIGGGKGHCLQQIQRSIADIKGRLILQERPEVLSDTYDLENSRIEKYEYNFFETQPIKGAHIYYIRRVLHDWPDHICVDILKNTAAAMERDKSRIVIAECLVLPMGTDFETAWLDLVMMALTGAERTRKHWEELLDAAGLKLERVYTALGTNYGAMQAVLK